MCEVDFELGLEVSDWQRWAGGCLTGNTEHGRWREVKLELTQGLVAFKKGGRQNA